MSDDSRDGLAEPHIWKEALPQNVFEGLREWASAQPFTVRHLYRLAGGLSGSYVAVVRIIPDHGILRQAVLKVVPPDIAKIETRGVGLARQYTPPEFWAAHMVPTSDRDFLPRTDWCVHLQETASADLTELRPLAELLDAPDFAEHCGALISALVNGWHQPADPPPLVSTTRDFLAEFLDRHQAGLDDFARAARLRRDEPVGMVRVPGRNEPLPNPFGLLSGAATDELADVRNGRVEVYVANGHGDLQLFNVLIPYATPIDANGFRLIDYGRFSPRMPVSRDPVKLLLSIAGVWLRKPEFAPGTDQRSRLADVVVAPRTVDVNAMAGYTAVSQRISDAARQWGVRRNMVAEWQRQFLLVLIGSALRSVANRDLTPADRWWHFEVAALATRAYATTEFVGARVEAPAPPVPSDLAELERERWRPSRRLVATAAAGVVVAVTVALAQSLPPPGPSTPAPAATSADPTLGPDPGWISRPLTGVVSITSPVPDARVTACVRLTGTAHGLGPDKTLVIAKRRADMFTGTPFAYILVHDWDEPSSLAAWSAEVSLGPAVYQEWDLVVLIADLADIRREKDKPTPATAARFRRGARVTVKQASSERPC